jgi:hypothetical protein
MKTLTFAGSVTPETPVPLNSVDDSSRTNHAQISLAGGSSPRQVLVLILRQLRARARACATPLGRTKSDRRLNGLLEDVSLSCGRAHPHAARWGLVQLCAIIQHVRGSWTGQAIPCMPCAGEQIPCETSRIVAAALFPPSRSAMQLTR